MLTPEMKVQRAEIRRLNNQEKRRKYKEQKKQNSNLPEREDSEGERMIQSMLDSY